MFFLSKFIENFIKPMWVKQDLFKVLERLDNQAAKIHDIKLQFDSNIHEVLERQGYSANSKNRCIILANIPIRNKEISVKALVYPNTVQINIGCSYSPIIYERDSMLNLHEILTEISLYLYDLGATYIPPVNDWMITHYHLNKDGTDIDLNGKSFHITIANATEGFIRYYSKEMPDGSLIPRIEQIRRPHQTFANELQLVIAQNGITHDKLGRKNVR